MTESVTIPDGLPVLGHGAHEEGPQYGACFMEYTALLAGLPFTDGPNCTDGWIAGQLIGVNDHASDATRNRMASLLGRAIGLVAPTGGDPWIDVEVATEFEDAVRQRYVDLVAERYHVNAIAHRYDRADGDKSVMVRDISALAWHLLRNRYADAPDPSGTWDFHEAAEDLASGTLDDEYHARLVEMRSWEDRWMDACLDLALALHEAAEQEMGERAWENRWTPVTTLDEVKALVGTRG
jgi:hypothetical protein